MQVQFLCECGQAIRTELSEGPRSVQCPTCGKMLTVAGTESPLHAYASPQAAPPPPAGKAVASLVLGICGFVPGLGVLAGPVGIGLGIAVLVKKLRGRGFGIAGIATGAAGLVIVQTLTALWVYMMVMVFSTVSSRMATMTPPMTTMAITTAPAAPPTPLPRYGGRTPSPTPPSAVPPRRSTPRPVPRIQDVPPTTRPAGPERP